MSSTPAMRPPLHIPRAWLRGILAGPVCFIAAALVMAGGALWLPEGPAKIDNMVLPIVLFPVIWAALFFYLMLDHRLGRAWLVALLLVAGHAGMIARHLLATPAAAGQGSGHDATGAAP
ncbi:MAG: hypothetical protein NTW01_01805 [Gammaproteobacteria bacterium]|nr:hypothetical protein [Gammaproteobacteria bacterium]